MQPMFVKAYSLAHNVSGFEPAPRVVCQCNGHGVCTNNSHLTIDSTLENQLATQFNALDVDVADPFSSGSSASQLTTAALATCAACFNHTQGAHCGTCSAWYYGDPSNGAFCSRASCSLSLLLVCFAYGVGEFRACQTSVLHEMQPAIAQASLRLATLPMGDAIAASRASSETSAISANRNLSSVLYNRSCAFVLSFMYFIFTDATPRMDTPDYLNCLRAFVCYYSKLCNNTAYY